MIMMFWSRNLSVLLGFDQHTVYRNSVKFRIENSKS